MNRKKQVDWLERSVILLSGVFLYSLLTWLSSYWAEGTKPIVIVVLLTVCVTEMYLFRRTWLRRMCQFFLLFGVLVYWLEWDIGGVSFTSWDEMQQAILFVGDQLLYYLPVFLIVLGTWIIYIVTIRWFESKWRAVGTLFISVLFFSVLDTFTSLSLWVDIVIMICAVLLLLMVHQFRALREKSEEAWEHLTDYPETFIVPIAAIMSIVVFTGIFAPDIRPLVTDPYTLWKKHSSSKVETGVNPNRNSDANSSLPVSGDSISGYSRDDQELGGGFSFDYSPVMTIDTSYPTYYRGESRSLYTGAGWVEDKEDELFQQAVFVDGEASTFQGDRDYIDTSLLETREITQTITFSPRIGRTFPVLFGAYSISELSITDYFEEEVGLSQERSPIVEYRSLENEDAENSFIWLPHSEEIHFVSDDETAFPMKYEVVSEIPIIDETSLRMVNNVNLEEGYWQRYLQLPEELPDRIFDLAEEIVDLDASQYDQVLAIESFLKDTYEYTTEPDTSLGESTDFVDRFLFEVEEGYCDYFSTAMVVLARTLDIPARWVKGYTQGTRVEEEIDYYFMEQDPTAPGTFQVRNSNAHSWVEVYFEGYGWISFEPTPAFSLPTLYATEEVPAENVEEIDVATDGQEEDKGTFSLSDIPWFHVGLIVSIAVLSVALVVVGKKRSWHFSRIWRDWKKGRLATTLNEKIIIEFERFLRFANRKGYEKEEYETMRETFIRWGEKDSKLEGDLMQVLLLFDKAKYGSRGMRKVDLEKTRKKVMDIKKRMKG
ncbi:transglutaminaseTgpA domain-containing protein [Evansella sp. AB-rgal1]|uniref:transglutaminase-like domain-containing protein n=1 Tax=Evansella sp. AB-rgal1 TaxID=3242696 RepID=UPI00359F0742